MAGSGNQDLDLNAQVRLGFAQISDRLARIEEKMEAEHSVMRANLEAQKAEDQRIWAIMENRADKAELISLTKKVAALEIEAAKSSVKMGVVWAGFGCAGAALVSSIASILMRIGV